VIDHQKGLYNMFPSAGIALKHFIQVENA
jgi:hypothetical protein